MTERPESRAAPGIWVRSSDLVWARRQGKVCGFEARGFGCEQPHTGFPAFPRGPGRKKVRAKSSLHLLSGLLRVSEIVRPVFRHPGRTANAAHILNIEIPHCRFTCFDTKRCAVLPQVDFPTV